MTKDQIKQKLIDEGFVHIYEWKDEGGKSYASHAHKGKVVLYIIQGSIEFTFGDSKQLVHTGDRFDVPPGGVHTAIVGPDGCEYIVGEMIEGDS